MPSPGMQTGRMDSLIDSTIQTAIQQRAVDHEEHKRTTPDVSTCVLPLGTARSERASEVDSAQLFLTIIQLHANLIAHTSTHKPKSCGDGRVAKQQVLDTLEPAAADLHTGGSVCMVVFREDEAVSGQSLFSLQKR